jgi:Flp pilus assembly protein TadD
VGLEPGYAEAHNNLGSVLAQAGRVREAIAEYEEALRIRPGYAKARANLEQLKVLQPAR